MSDKEKLTELELLDIEEKKFDLEIKRAAVAKLRQAEQQRADAAAAQRRDVALNAKRDNDVLRQCNHMKGGRDGASLEKKGDEGGDYCVVKSADGFGGRSVLCTRCIALWKKGDTAEKHPTGISFETAWGWPSSNQQAIPVQFGVKTDDAQQKIAQLQRELAAAKAK